MYEKSMRAQCAKREIIGTVWGFFLSKYVTIVYYSVNIKYRDETCVDD